MSMKPISAMPVTTVRIASAVPFDGMMLTLRPFLLEIALAERDVPGRMPAQTDEIEHEFDVALLRPGGRGPAGRLR